jgi:DNA-binding NarL/FixJ family response regulator
VQQQTDGREAVEMALSLKPDLMIVDLVMPGLSGAEVIGVLKKKLPTTKFILFTMYEDQVGKFLTLSAGVDVVEQNREGCRASLRRLRPSSLKSAKNAMCPTVRPLQTHGD